VGLNDVADVGSSNSEGNGEWHFHVWGPLGVFCLDVKESRIWKGRTGANASDSPLLSDEQWRCFSDALATENLNTIVLTCEVPFIDDSIGDARYKATDPSHGHLDMHWPFHGSELLRLLNGLFDWKHAEKGREVVLIGGGINVGVDTLIRHSGGGDEIRQFIVGPAASTPETDLWAERTGSLDENITYEHGKVLKENNCCYCGVKGDEVGDIATTSLVCTPPEFFAHIGGQLGLQTLPIMLKELHVDKKSFEDSKEDSIVLVKGGGGEVEMEEQTLRLNLKLLSSIMQKEEVVEGLKKVYAKLHGGERRGFDDARGFSVVASRELCKYYWLHAPAVLRDVALPPNRYILEVVGNLWEQGVVPARKAFEEEVDTRGMREKVLTEEEKQALGTKNLPLGLLNDKQFVILCGEIFKNALLVRTNFLIKKRGEMLK